MGTRFALPSGSRQHWDCAEERTRLLGQPQCTLRALELCRRAYAPSGTTPMTQRSRIRVLDYPLVLDPGYRLSLPLQRIELGIGTDKLDLLPPLTRGQCPPYNPLVAQSDRIPKRRETRDPTEITKVWLACCKIVTRCGYSQTRLCCTTPTSQTLTPGRQTRIDIYMWTLANAPLVPLPNPVCCGHPCGQSLPELRVSPPEL